MTGNKTDVSWLHSLWKRMRHSVTNRNTGREKQAADHTNIAGCVKDVIDTAEYLANQNVRMAKENQTWMNTKM
jgi:hypothetical protein